MNIDHSNKSPHRRTRGNTPIAGVVLHYTGGGTATSSIAWLCNDASKVSAHYVISRNGKVSELVAPHSVAYHVGVGEMRVGGEMKSSPNDFTIGIELANHGALYRDEAGNFWWGDRNPRRYEGVEPVHAVLVYDDGTEADGYWEPYPEAQLAALEELLEQLGFDNVVGHEEIAMPMGRKRDPGPLFPWDRFPRSVPRRTRRSAPLDGGY